MNSYCLRPFYFRQIDSMLELSDQIGKLKDLMSGLGQMVVLVSMLLDVSVVTKNVKFVNYVGLLDETVWWLWSCSSFDVFLDSYAVRTYSSFSGSISFRSEFNYLLSCFNLFFKVTFISKCFYDSLIVNEIGCLVSMIGRLLSNVQVYWLMNYLNSLYRVAYSGFDVSSANLNVLLSVNVVAIQLNKFLFDAIDVFRLSDEYFVLRFYLKGWLNWSEFMCWVYHGVSYFYLHSLFNYGYRNLVSLVFLMLHYLVDYLKKVMTNVFNLGLGAVCNVWIGSFVFKGFAYELNTLDLWVFVFLVITIKSIKSFSFFWV